MTGVVSLVQNHTKMSDFVKGAHYAEDFECETSFPELKLTPNHRDEAPLVLSQADRHYCSLPPSEARLFQG